MKFEPSVYSGILDGGSLEIASGTLLNDTQEAWLDNYRKAVPSSIDIYVTSGIRSASAQASAMYTKYQYAGGGSAGWEELYNTYRADDVIDEIKSIVEALGGASSSTFSTALSTIDAAGKLSQLSRHASGDALDIRTKDQSDKDIEKLISKAESLGATTLLEENPPHLHIQGLALGATDLARIPFLGTAWSAVSGTVDKIPAWALWTAVGTTVVGSAAVVWWNVRE